MARSWMEVRAEALATGRLDEKRIHALKAKLLRGRDRGEVRRRAHHDRLNGVLVGWCRFLAFTERPARHGTFRLSRGRITTAHNEGVTVDA